MNERAGTRLIRAHHWATSTSVVHGVAILWALRETNRQNSSLWASYGDLWAKPALILATQILAVAGLLFLCHALRGMARDLSKAPESVPTVRSPLFLGPATSVATAFAIGSAIWGAARGWFGPTVFTMWILTPPLVFLAAGRLIPPTVHTGLALERERQTLVSRLRGMSILAALMAAAVMATSGSVAVGALLPVAMLEGLPHGRVPDPDTWPLNLASLESGARGSTGTPTPTDTRASESHRAAEAVQVLIFTGSPKAPDALELPPTRRHDAWWDLGSPPSLPDPPHEWANRLFITAESGQLDSDGIGFLESMAVHPANAEFDRLGSAVSADIRGTRWRPLPERPVAAFELPIPRYVELWNGVRGRIAGATYLALQGDSEEAVRRLGTVVQLGYLLYQDGPLTLDALLGAQIAHEGVRALNSLGGHPEQAAQVVTSVSDAPSMPRHQGAAGTPRRLEWLRQYEAALHSAEAPRGLKWEAFTLVNSYLPCASPHNVLWGPGEADRMHRRETGASLANHPSETDLARLLEHGYLGTRTGGDGWGWLPNVLGVVLADRPAVTHCAPVVAFLATRG